MTIPMVVWLISGIVWLICAKVPQVSDSWAIDVLRILFAASTLVVLLGVTGKPVF